MNEIWKEIKITGLLEAIRASMLQNHPLKALIVAHDLFGELYLRVIMSSDHGWNHNSLNALHHFFSAYGNDEEIPSHHSNK